MAKKSTRKLTVPKEFKLTNMQPSCRTPKYRGFNQPREPSEADRLYALLERKGILDIADSNKKNADEACAIESARIPLLNAKLFHNYDQAMAKHAKTIGDEQNDTIGTIGSISEIPQDPQLMLQYPTLEPMSDFLLNEPHQGEPFAENGEPTTMMLDL